MTNQTITIAGVLLTLGAARAIEEVGGSVAYDVTRVRAGLLRLSLLCECLSGAEPDRVADWTDYVDAVMAVVAAMPRKAVLVTVLANELSQPHPTGPTAVFVGVHALRLVPAAARISYTGAYASGGCTIGREVPTTDDTWLLINEDGTTVGLLVCWDDEWTVQPVLSASAFSPEGLTVGEVAFASRLYTGATWHAAIATWQLTA